MVVFFELFSWEHFSNKVWGGFFFVDILFCGALNGILFDIFIW
jgi:hypothetical protein